MKESWSIRFVRKAMEKAIKEENYEFAKECKIALDKHKKDERKS